MLAAILAVCAWQGLASRAEAAGQVSSTSTVLTPPPPQPTVTPAPAPAPITGGGLTETQRPPRTWESGVMAGYGPWADLEFAQWRGALIDTATDFTPWTSWDQIENPAWAIWAWRMAPQVRPVFSMPLWPNTGGSLAEAASGAYAAHFAALARNLVAAGLGTTMLRIGWEFNGTWYPWSARTAADAADFAAAWRSIVTAMRAVPGQQFRFVWSPTLSPTGIDPALAYPGDAYVTDVGASVYNWNRIPGAGPHERWDDLVNGRYGLAWHARFAAAHGKPVAFPEWGLAHNDAAPAAGGGDDPTFVQNMYLWFATHDTSFENYFDIDTDYGLKYGLNTGNGLFPNAAALYRQLWGGA